MDKKTTGRTLLHELFVRDHVGYYNGLNPANVSYPDCIDFICQEKYKSTRKGQKTAKQNVDHGHNTQMLAQTVDRHQNGTAGHETIEMDELSLQQASLVQDQSPLVSTEELVASVRPKIEQETDFLIKKTAISRGSKKVSKNYPIEPGLFKVEYGNQTQMIDLTFQSDSFIGTKIIGNIYDSPVPAGKRTFEGKLCDALIMNEEEQVRERKIMFLL